MRRRRQGRRPRRWGGTRRIPWSQRLAAWRLQPAAPCATCWPPIRGSPRTSPPRTSGRGSSSTPIRARPRNSWRGWSEPPRHQADRSGPSGHRAAAMPEALSSGCRTWYTADGPAGGPPLLLSNSLGTTASLWDAALPALTARCRVIRYDTRGHGRTSVPPGPYSLETLGRDAIAVLDAAGVERAHVCGISLGGLVGMWLGVFAPERVRGLILANTGAQIGTAELWNQRISAVEAKGMGAMVDRLLQRWFTPGFRKRRPDVIARFRAMIESCSPTGYAGCCAAVRDADLRDAIGRIRAPSLVIVGTHDV